MKFRDFIVTLANRSKTIKKSENKTGKKSGNLEATLAKTPKSVYIGCVCN